MKKEDIFEKFFIEKEIDNKFRRLLENSPTIKQKIKLCESFLKKYKEQENNNKTNLEEVVISFSKEFYKSDYGYNIVNDIIARNKYEISNSILDTLINHNFILFTIREDFMRNSYIVNGKVIVKKFKNKEIS